MRSLFIIDKLLISKFIKFGVVGCSGMLIDFGTTYLCKEILRLNTEETVVFVLKGEAFLRKLLKKFIMSS